MLEVRTHHVERKIKTMGSIGSEISNASTLPDKKDFFKKSRIKDHLETHYQGLSQERTP